MYMRFMDDVTHTCIYHRICEWNGWSTNSHCDNYLQGTDGRAMSFWLMYFHVPRWNWGRGKLGWKLLTWYKALDMLTLSHRIKSSFVYENCYWLISHLLKMKILILIKMWIVETEESVPNNKQQIFFQSSLEIQNKGSMELPLLP